VGGRHFHHLVLGIAGLLGTGYLWLIETNTAGKTSGTDDASRSSRRSSTAELRRSRLTKFALWLDLEDVYWTRQGRASVDAVVLFGGALSSDWGPSILPRCLPGAVTHLIARRRFVSMPSHGHVTTSRRSAVAAPP